MANSHIPIHRNLTDGLKSSASKTALAESRATKTQTGVKLPERVDSVAHHPSQGTAPTPLLNEQQAAELLALKVPTLRRWRWAGKGPPFVKIGSSVRYRLEDLETFITTNLRHSTTQKPEDRS